MTEPTRGETETAVVDFPGRELTGTHVFMITAAAFSVIIGVNVLLAWKAVSTFPGIEVSNGYVASQTFEAERTAQNALGWNMGVRLRDGRLTVDFKGPDGGPANVVAVEADLGRPTTTAEDRMVVFRHGGGGLFEAPADLAQGRWVMHVTAMASDGTTFRQRVMIWSSGS